MPWLHKYLGNPVLSWLGRLLFKVPIRDFHCGLRAFRRESILALNLQSDHVAYVTSHDQLADTVQEHGKILQTQSDMNPFCCL
jgi:hypothetical protein